MKIKSLTKHYTLYLPWLLLLSSIFWNIYQYRQYQAEQALETERQKVSERLENSWLQSRKLFAQTNQKKAEIDQINADLKQCLNKAKPSLNECENLLAKSVELVNKFDAIGKEYEKLLDSTNKDYCILYPNAVDRNCQQVEK